MSRTVLVTGASRGIGAAITDDLLALGYTVVGLARQHTRSPSAHFHPVRVDLADLDTLGSTLSAVLRDHPDVSALVSNAGGPAFGHLEQFSEARVRSSLDLNLTSHILVAQKVVPLLKTRGDGDIVFMGSEAALRGGKRGSVYCAAKFGLRGFSQSLREETQGRGVRVTLVNPGMVRTGFFDQEDFRPGPEDAHAVLPKDVAQAVRLVLTARRGTVFEEINIAPQTKHIDFVRKAP